ncbi:divalent metal cation transporter [Corynebacterium sp. 153RC1]|uniref:NRAMP family divalent metal transporter n=1 Tax=unclassified Corynebacterium TaxID=2624378 RepID=UPI00211C92BF|nr:MULTISPECIES: NRAMP family divalent metal transporter [unclassified Corynebacterium]MCQ9351925.1 divalent metal cation transporter [Corynebacterium sp. 209RC1]MCQ9353674.1 divalent metal cation transporter [Corynebacterium sp. 1222RC1]MCQ9356342.1 divalent metal cation transporter [Corynebacterium sp. 122RC1]MCQ9358444.1 divalent metal cation transporter [Corynebacterium sp. 142RC1]MCQ9360821.1 divalent metal cation transporter [Corynebacterium sp. 153RC1]
MPESHGAPQNGAQRSGAPQNGAPQPSPTLKQAAASATTRSTLLGAIFLMATSAIGPGFLTQTATFTAQLGAAFAFAIVVSIIIDIAVQLNVWRVIGISGMRAQELGNSVLPGLGWVLAVLIAIGGAVFNIGNIAGGGLGLNAMLGLDAKIGGAITAVIAIAIFLFKQLGAALDKILVALGVIMMALTIYVAFVSGPPVGDALRNSVLPEQVDWLTITTLVGGTVGGYITYAGAHRMLDSGLTGKEHVQEVSRSSVTGILLTGVMRIALFLAVLGVVAGGVVLDTKANPAAQAFESAAGEIGLRFFGAVLWAAALSSVIGASYTSASFLVANKPEKKQLQNWITIGFIVLSCSVFLVLGTAPAALLVFAGAFNGLVLPIGFTLIIYVAAMRSKDLLQGYQYPKWLIAIGLAAMVVAWWLAWRSFGGVFQLLGISG